MDIKRSQQTCTACPAQWEITLENGHMLYIWYRWGCLYIGLSRKPTTNIFDAIGDEAIVLFEGQISDDLHGYMAPEQMHEHLAPFLCDGVIEGYLKDD